jgi:hypothetical protein
MIDRQDVTEILTWVLAAFFVLALVNSVSELVPLKKPANSDYVMNKPRR